MLLPPELAPLASGVTPMATTREAAAVGRALRRLLGDRPGVIEMLALRTGWVARFEDFAEIARAVAPLAVPPREARALAGCARGLYLPGVGALLNGALIGGTTRLALADALDEPETRARAILHLAHEVAGHGFLAENTAIGRRQLAGASRRAAVSFAGRFLRLEGAREAADASLRETLTGGLACEEGWARWVTERMRPLLAEEMPELAALFAHDRRSERKRLRDRRAAEALPGLLASMTEDDALRLLTGCGRDGAPYSADSLGLALLNTLAAAGGDAACILAVEAACRAPESAGPDLLLWESARLASSSRPR